MPNDAMIVAIDRIRFTWSQPKKMRLYAVGISADNRGKVLVTEPPGSAEIRHRPGIGKPAVWDFAGDGYAIYQRTGRLADIIVAHLVIVRDRGRVRSAGETVRRVSQSGEARKTIETTSEALAVLNGGGLAAATALSVVLPIAAIVGEILSEKKDVVLQTISGSLFLDRERRAERHFTQTILSPDNNMEVEADAFLFDAAADEDTVAETEAAETRLKAAGMLYVEPGR